MTEIIFKICKICFSLSFNGKEMKLFKTEHINEQKKWKTMG